MAHKILTPVGDQGDSCVKCRANAIHCPLMSNTAPNTALELLRETFEKCKVTKNGSLYCEVTISDNTPITEFLIIVDIIKISAITHTGCHFYTEDEHLDDPDYLEVGV